MPGAGAGQEIAERLNGLKRMPCPPPRGSGKSTVHPLLPGGAVRRPAWKQPDPRALLSSAGGGAGAGGGGGEGPRNQEVQPGPMRQEGGSCSPAGGRVGPPIRPKFSGPGVRGCGRRAGAPRTSSCLLLPGPFALTATPRMFCLGLGGAHSQVCSLRSGEVGQTQWGSLPPDLKVAHFQIGFCALPWNKVSGALLAPWLPFRVI